MTLHEVKLLSEHLQKSWLEKRKFRACLGLDPTDVGDAPVTIPAQGGESQLHFVGELKPISGNEANMESAPASPIAEEEAEVISQLEEESRRMRVLTQHLHL